MFCMKEIHDETKVNGNNVSFDVFMFMRDEDVPMFGKYVPCVRHPEVRRIRNEDHVLINLSVSVALSQSRASRDVPCEKRVRNRGMARRKVIFGK